MNRGLLMRILFYLWMILAFVGGWTVTTEFLNRDAPIEFISATANSSAVPQGGTIDIHFEVNRYRICPVQKVQRVLLDASGQEHAISNYTLATNTKPGRESYDRTIEIPDAASLGPASYRITIYYTCNVVQNLGWPIKVSSPPARFTIVPPVDPLKLPAFPLPLQRDN